MATKKDIKKYGIKSTYRGYPDLEVALHKAKETIGWKSLSAHLVKWCNEHQPLDTNYSLPFWQKEMPLKNAVNRRKINSGNQTT